SGINPSGYTGMRLHISAAAPAPTGANNVSFWGVGQKCTQDCPPSGVPQPCLLIDFIVPPPDAPTPTPTPTATPGGPQQQYFCVRTTADDGDVRRSDSIYPPGGTPTPSTSGNLVVHRGKSGSTYVVEPSLLRFDTTGLPAGSTITAAGLLLKSVLSV